ncbi:AAA family ATPase [Clostridium gasigenes]|uniref:AAA family ATPase n=1 Tax=Clostridium gasigenes TaxID=94869 RepID=A0A7X0SAB3_9CLOT|nr:AAA family ATPase [Clostridium gasigenes]MBB6713904.1 AAA family ATPase [Clostridium gasigenes]
MQLDIPNFTRFLSQWYKVLKIGTEIIVKRIFATGVSPITLDSLTSRFNIASDYGKIGNMFELKDKSSNMKILDEILKGEEISAIITSQFSLEKYFDEDDK